MLLFGWKYTDYEDHESGFASTTRSLHRRFVPGGAWICRFPLLSPLFLSFSRSLSCPRFVACERCTAARQRTHRKLSKKERKREREREHLMFQRVKTVGSRFWLRYWKDDCHFARDDLVICPIHLRNNIRNSWILKSIEKFVTYITSFSYTL